MIYLLSVISALQLSITKHKKGIVVAGFLVAYLVYLMGAITPGHSFDTYAYQLIYSWTPGSHRFEPLYMQLSYLFFRLGLPYIVFRTAYYGAAMAILWWAVKRFNGNMLTYFSIFAVYPFLVEITQVRNFGMIVLVALALSFLQDKNKKSWVIACVLLILSFNLQASGLIYLAMPFLILVNGATMQKLVERGYLVMLVLTTIIHYFIPVDLANRLVSMGFRIAGRAKTDAFHHFGSGASFSVAIGYFIFLGVLILVWKYLLSWQPGLLERREYRVLYAPMLIAVVSVLLIASSIDFERYIRDGFTLSLIAFSMYEREFIKRIDASRKFWLPIAVLVVIGTIAYHYWDPSSTGRLQYLIYLIQLFPNLNWG